MKNLFAISTVSFALTASILAAHDALAQSVKMQEPNNAYASLSYAVIEGISAPKITFGTDINRYVSGQVSYLQSGQGKSEHGNNNLSYRSAQANLIARPFADLVNPYLVQPYLKAGISRDTVTLKTGEITIAGTTFDQNREKNSVGLSYGAGLDIPMRHFSKDLFLTADYSRHEYFQSNIKPVNVAAIGLKAKY